MIAMGIEKDIKQEQEQHSDESLADASMASKFQQQPTTLQRLQDQPFFIVFEYDIGQFLRSRKRASSTSSRLPCPGWGKKIELPHQS